MRAPATIVVLACAVAAVLDPRRTTVAAAKVLRLDSLPALAQPPRSQGVQARVAYEEARAAAAAGLPPRYLAPFLKSSDGLGAQWLIAGSVLGHTLCHAGRAFAWPGLTQLAHHNASDYATSKLMTSTLDQFIGLTQNPNIAKVNPGPR